MTYRLIVIVTLLILSSSVFCAADTLVITYRSGKTQTIILEESSTSINSWQFVGGAAATYPAQVPQIVNQETKKTTGVKTEIKSPEKKSNIRTIWNAPPIRD